MNKKFIEQMKRAALTENSIVVSAWASIAVVLDSSGWSWDEINELVNKVQNKWKSNEDYKIVRKCETIGIDTLDFVRYDEVDNSKKSRASKKSYIASKETAAILYAAISLVLKEDYDWEKQDIKNLLTWAIETWNDLAKVGIDIVLFCAQTTGNCFVYNRNAS